MNQKTALDVMKLGYNVYLTGPAGSGKTWLLNQYIDYLKKKEIDVAVTASTGIAATHMNGITIHSWCRMGVKTKITEQDLHRLYRIQKLRDKLKKAKVLIIDEISMLHAYQLDLVDKILRFFKEPLMPFGGMQVILSGDFFQLPPVAKGMEKAHFVFASKAWQEMNIKICYLDEIKRQSDDRMKKILNDIRNQEVDEITRKLISSREDDAIDLPIEPTRLYTINKDVDYINNQELGKIKGKPYSYTMQDSGRQVFVDILKKNCLAPEKLILKRGALVMFLKNNFEEGYVNGTMGKVIDFDGESKLPIVKTVDGKNILVEPASWEFEEDEEMLASIRQLPLRLAWAITVHKSQGMTLDAAEIDLTRTFEHGMGYVALSRVKSLEGIKLLGIHERALQINPDIFELDGELMRLSDLLAKEIEKMSWVKRSLKQIKYIKALKEK